MIGSLNPPPSVLPIPSQIIFDEIGCILTEQLLLDCRVRADIEADLEWQNVLFAHPVNLLTWPKILEKCLLLRNLPLSKEEARLVLNSPAQGDPSVHLKVLCLLYSHPCIDFFVGSQGVSPGHVGEKLSQALRSVLRSLSPDSAHEKLSSAEFCSELVD